MNNNIAEPKFKLRQTYIRREEINYQKKDSTKKNSEKKKKNQDTERGREPRENPAPLNLIDGTTHSAKSTAETVALRLGLVGRKRKRTKR